MTRLAEFPATTCREPGLRLFNQAIDCSRRQDSVNDHQTRANGPGSIPELGMYQPEVTSGQRQ
jgi:hypothetical protein